MPTLSCNIESLPENARPTLFLDFDDVIALNREDDYGGYDVIAPNPPPDLWNRLFSRDAVTVLHTVMDEFGPQVVLTTSWLRFLEREAFVQILNRTGIGQVATNLHPAWAAYQDRGKTRSNAIDDWMAAHYCGEKYVILDDDLSGTGLKESEHFRNGRVVLCEGGKGLDVSHLQMIRKAISAS